MWSITISTLRARTTGRYSRPRCRHVAPPEDGRNERELSGIGEVMHPLQGFLLATACAAAGAAQVKTPSPILKAASAIVTPLLGPVYKVEAPLQGAVLGALADRDEVRAEIDETIGGNGCVIYTYALSPFSTEAIALLESTGCKFEKVELGLEWFLLGPKASIARQELGEMTGQTSLPHVFIGGEHVGGLYSDPNGGGGLAQLAEEDELLPMLQKARALAGPSKQAGFSLPTPFAQ